MIISCITFAHLSVPSTPLSQSAPSCCGCWCYRLLLHSGRSLRRRRSRLRPCYWRFTRRRRFSRTRLCHDSSASTGRTAFAISLLACWSCCHCGSWTFGGLSARRACRRVLRCGFCWATRRLFRSRRLLTRKSRFYWRPWRDTWVVGFGREHCRCRCLQTRSRSRGGLCISGRGCRCRLCAFLWVRELCAGICVLLIVCAKVLAANC